MKNSELLTRQEAADYLGVTIGTLSNWASTKSQVIPMIKVGRLVKYRLSDLEQWLESRKIDYSREKIK